MDQICQTNPTKRTEREREHFFPGLFLSFSYLLVQAMATEIHVQIASSLSCLFHLYLHNKSQLNIVSLLSTQAVMNRKALNTNNNSIRQTITSQCNFQVGTWPSKITDSTRRGQESEFSWVHASSTTHQPMQAAAKSKSSNRSKAAKWMEAYYDHYDSVHCLMQAHTHTHNTRSMAQ